MSESKAKTEFYVGYLEEAPRGIGRFMRRAVAAVLLLVVAIGALLTSQQSPFSKAVYEYGSLFPVEGVLEAAPYPTLVATRPGGGVSRYLLTVFGKHGAEEQTQGLEGHRIRFQGTLIHRDGQTMVEIGPDPIEDLGLAVAAAEDSSPGSGPSQEQTDGLPVTLVGEIVDSKCFLGVMKPGNLKPHRSCATRCISGGVPPVLLVRDEQGNANYFLLTDAEGGAVNRAVVARGLIAEPVRITGMVERLGDRLLLHADPASYERLP